MSNIQTTERKISVGRIVRYALAFGFSALATYFCGGVLSNKADVLGLIATIFSILAGVLIAVISILGDPSMLIDQSWRHSYLSAKETQRKIHRQTNVFMLYILLLAALFVFLMTDASSPWYFYVQHTAFFFTVLGFLASLALPYTLRAIQRERLQKAINQTAGKSGSGRTDAEK